MRPYRARAAGFFLVATYACSSDSVVETPVVSAVTVAPPAVSLSVGGMTQLSATVLDSRGAVLPDRSVAWSTENGQVAAVSSSGLVTAVAPGTSRIFATTDGTTGQATVTVASIPVATVVVSPGLVNLLTGQSRQFSATVRDGAGNVLLGREVIWSTSNSSVATVSQSGLATATGAGTASVIATSEGRSGFAILSVATGGSWTTSSSMPSPRYGLGVGVINGLLYAAGGFHQTPNAALEVYDPVTNSWSQRAPMPTARYGNAVGVVNGLLHVVGGAVGVGTLEVYNPSTNSWVSRSNMPTQRQELGAGVVNGLLYAVGGYNFTTTVNTVEAYDPNSNTWTTKAPMPTPRRQLAVAELNGILYAIGGITPSGADLAVVEAYDPSTNTWSTKAPMPTARAGSAASVINGILYVIGGTAGSTTVESYNPATNSWATETPMPTGRRYLGAGTVNGVLFAVGGFLAGAVGSVGANVVEAFRP